MNFQTLQWDFDGAKLTIWLNRQQSLNALTTDMRREILTALAEADQNDSVRVIVFRGRGRAFSVGQDLKEMQDYYAQNGPELGRLVKDEYIPIVKALRAASKPTVAVLEGAAVGGGMALALAADFRLATPKGQMIPAFVNVGLAPDTGAAFLLARSIGYSRALSRSLLGTPITADEMMTWGLVEGIYQPGDELEEALGQLVDRLAQGPTRAYSMIRQLYDKSVHLPLESVLEEEAETQDVLAHTADHLEAVDAFLAKRSPNFQGR